MLDLVEHNASDIEAAHTLLGTCTVLCNAHLARQVPLDQWYPNDFRGVLDGGVTIDPQLFFSDYSTPDVDELFNRPLVSGPGAGSGRLPDGPTRACDRQRSPAAGTNGPQGRAARPQGRAVAAACACAGAAAAAAAARLGRRRCVRRARPRPTAALSPRSRTARTRSSSCVCARRSGWPATGSTPGSPAWPRARSRPSVRWRTAERCGSAASDGSSISSRTGRARGSLRASSTRPRWSTPPRRRCCDPAGTLTAPTTPSRRWPSTCARSASGPRHTCSTGCVAAARWAICSAAASSGACTTAASTTSSTTAGAACSSRRTSPVRPAAPWTASRWPRSTTRRACGSTCPTAARSPWCPA